MFQIRLQEKHYLRCTRTHTQTQKNPASRFLLLQSGCKSDPSPNIQPNTMREKSNMHKSTTQTPTYAKAVWIICTHKTFYSKWHGWILALHCFLNSRGERGKAIKSPWLSIAIWSAKIKAGLRPKYLLPPYTGSLPPYKFQTPQPHYTIQELTTKSYFGCVRKLKRQPYTRLVHYIGIILTHIIVCECAFLEVALENGCCMT